MKTKYILAAAHRWNGDTATSPLPTDLLDSKLEEIRMIRPALPFLHPLTFNPLLCPGSPASVFSRVAIWQERSRMLSAWIGKARLNSRLVPNCSWRWPESPVTSHHRDDDSVSIGLSSTTTECDSLFHEEPATPSRAIRAYGTKPSLVPPKRSRDLSPLDTRRDGDDPSKKQLVLWRPSIRQLIEQQHALATGEVPSGSSVSSHLHAPVLSSREASRSSLTHSSTTLDPRRRLHVPYSPSQPLTALNSSHQSNPVRTLRG